MDKAEPTTGLLQQQRPQRVIVCLKVFLHAFNVFFLSVGIVLLAVGIWTATSLKPYFKLNSIHHSYSSWVLIAVGVAIMAISCSGFYCTQSNKRVTLLYLYGSFIMVIVVAQIAVGIAALVLRNKITVVLRDGLLSNMRKYENDTSFGDAWDDVQQKLQCCGVMNYTDWGFLPGNENGTIDSLPKSCCPTDVGCRNSSEAYQVGCYQMVDETVRSSLGVIVGIAFGFIAVQLLGEILAFCLASRTKHHLYEEVF